MRLLIKNIKLLPLLMIAVVITSCGRTIEDSRVSSDSAANSIVEIDRNASMITDGDAVPNIIIILADDLGWRDVGYNDSEINTPNFDALAAAGVRLERFYVQPTCSPTRAALMTGKSPLRLGITSPLSKNNPKGLPLSEKTLADHLGVIGYETAIVGKWHLGGRNLAYHPNQRGFDSFYGHVTGGVGYFDKVHGGGYDWQRNGVTVRDEGYATRLIANEAVSVLNSRDPTKPIFLYIAFGAPHLPNEAPEESIEAYSHIENKQRRIHAAMVSELDTAIGQIVSELGSLGLAENTLIWFMSDNGGLIPNDQFQGLPRGATKTGIEAQFGVKTTPRFIDFVMTNALDGGSDNHPFQGGKGDVSEGGVRVPSFVTWPKVLAPRADPHMATVQDVLPTLLEITGSDLEDPDEFDGRSIWSSLSAGVPSPPRDYIVQAFSGKQETAFFRFPYKLIAIEGQAPRLYNLSVDPLEDQNIAASQEQIVSDLQSAIDSFPRGVPVSIALQAVVDDPDYFGGVEDRSPWAEAAYNEE
ncbi:MAG: arylsulfatase [Henriciella sp.]